MSYQRKRGATRKHPLECDACEGYGQTRAGETVMIEVEAFTKDDPVVRKRLVTQHLGSGCLKCGGTGRLAPPAITEAEVAELAVRLLPSTLKPPVRVATIGPHRPALIGRPSILAAAMFAMLATEEKS